MSAAQRVSQYLNPGIRYLDVGSREKGEGTQQCHRRFGENHHENGVIREDFVPRARARLSLDIVQGLVMHEAASHGGLFASSMAVGWRKQ